ncbi:hypothetical protein MRBLWO14_000945 [Microbacterium sp. LWO14-1.2]|uniref:hypothetical protein n=1 Tax=Microbacterium sp. LWO14-1.2 TaxID=3135263 RepID=UPI0031399B02
MTSESPTPETASSAELPIASHAEVDEASTARRRPPVKWLVVGVGIVVALIVGIIVILNVVSAKSPFEAAIEDCNLEGSAYIRVGDDGDTLLIDTQGDDSPGARFTDTACVLVALGVPDSTVARMDSTRAMDGVQSDEFDGIKAQWSYHPDNGLDLILTR